uniref:Uncharacterized protein n=1 Tax=Dunaliella tertiolecta TaxID=3047 RepID=A0A7S3QT15_DUNTE
MEGMSQDTEEAVRQQLLKDQDQELAATIQSGQKRTHAESGSTDAHEHAQDPAQLKEKLLRLSDNVRHAHQQPPSGAPPSAGKAGTGDWANYQPPSAVLAQIKQQQQQQQQQLPPPPPPMQQQEYLPPPPPLPPNWQQQQQQQQAALLGRVLQQPQQQLGGGGVGGVPPPPPRPGMQPHILSPHLTSSPAPSTPLGATSLPGMGAAPHLPSMNVPPFLAGGPHGPAGGAAFVPPHVGPPPPFGPPLPVQQQLQQQQQQQQHPAAAAAAAAADAVLACLSCVLVAQTPWGACSCTGSSCKGESRPAAAPLPRCS